LRTGKVSPSSGQPGPTSGSDRLSSWVSVRPSNNPPHHRHRLQPQGERLVERRARSRSCDTPGRGPISSQGRDSGCHGLGSPRMPRPTHDSVANARWRRVWMNDHLPPTDSCSISEGSRRARASVDSHSRSLRSQASRNPSGVVGRNLGRSGCRRSSSASTNGATSTPMMTMRGSGSCRRWWCLSTTPENWAPDVGRKLRDPPVRVVIDRSPTRAELRRKGARREGLGRSPSPLLPERWSKTAIAEKLHMSRNTVYRELRTSPPAGVVNTTWEKRILPVWPLDT